MGSDTKDQKRLDRARRIVHISSAAAGAIAGIAILPGSDAPPLMAVQIGMVICLAREYGVGVSDSAVRATVYGLLGQIFGVTAARLASMWLPIPGSLVRGAVAASITETLGAMAIDKLEATESLA